MRHIAGLTLGIAAGAALCALWLAVAWLWQNYGWHVANFLVNHGDKKSHLGLLELVPPVAGSFILYVGIGTSIGLLPEDKVALRTYAWTISIVCAAVVIILAAAMFLLSYASAGALSLVMALYGIAMLLIPGLAIYFGARAGLEAV